MVQHPDAWIDVRFCDMTCSDVWTVGVLPEISRDLWELEPTGLSQKKEYTLKKSVFAVTAIMVLVVAGVVAHAQDQSKRALAEELLNLLNVKETQQKALAMYEQMIVGQIQKLTSKSQDPDAQAKVTSLMQKTLDIVRDATSWDKLKEDYIALYSQTYTESELKDIIAFYKTPSGQAYVKKQPEVLKRSFQLSGKMINRLMPKIQSMVNEYKGSVGSQPRSKPEVK